MSVHWCQVWCLCCDTCGKAFSLANGEEDRPGRVDRCLECIRRLTRQYEAEDREAREFMAGRQDRSSWSYDDWL